MATTSKEGSRRVNYPILTQGGSDNKSQCGTMFCNWIENNVQTLSINNWRASLVPAAAVIPAPIAYIKVVAVKKLVVELWARLAGPIFSCTGFPTGPFLLANLESLWLLANQDFYFEKIRVFKAGVLLEYISME